MTAPDDVDGNAATTKASLGIVGAGAAACVACCAGPILGFLAATGIASVLGTVVFGAVGLLAVLAVAGALWLRRRRRQPRCAPATGHIEPAGRSA